MPHIQTSSCAPPYCMINSGACPPSFSLPSMNYLVVFEMRRGFSIITPRLQLRALHACSADQCRSSHGLHCGEADLHPKANRFFPLFLSLSSSLSLSRFLSSTSLQSYHVFPPPRSGPPSLPIRLSRYRRGERERERERGRRVRLNVNDMSTVSL